MNKKFLSALFLGSIVMAGGTFTACSDYDDDINKLNERVDAVEQAIADLEAAIKAGSTITSVTPTDNGVIVNLSNGTSFELTNGKDGQSGTTGSVITIGANGNWFIDGVDTGKPSRGEAGAPGADGQDGVSGKYYIPGEDGYWIEVTPNADGTETKVTTSMSWAIDGIVTAAWDSANGYLYLDNVAGQTGVMVISLTDDLKSLVFVPEFYYQGIEAMSAKTFNYNALVVNKNITADGEFGTDAASLKLPNPATSMTPGLLAEYHMNPTSANVNDIKAYTYIAEDKAYTRAAGPTVVANVYDHEANNGILKVWSHLTDGTLKEIATDDEVTVMALQVHYNTSAGADTIITSDYAAVKAENIAIGKLALAKDTDTETVLPSHQRHLWEDAATAISNTADYNIVFDSQGVDLDELVRTHINEVGGIDDEWDVNAADGLVEDYGFKYSYQLVGYHVGDNQTSESAHAVINDENILKPCMPVNGQQPADFNNVQQNPASNGREPLVRVLLTDTVSNEIAAVGYIKFHITDKPVKDEVIDRFEFPFDEVYTVDCSKNNETHRLRWYQVEEEIFAELYEQQGISKEEFHNEFTLDGGTANATQYNNTTVTATPVTTPAGIVSQTTGDPGHEETEVLVWNWQNNDAYSWFNIAGNTSKSVIVRYTRTVGTVHEYVYVTLTWTPSAINTKPAGVIDNSDKISNYWYDRNSGEAGSGFSDIHANVETVGEVGANDDFISDILNTFVGNDVTVTGVDPVYTAFQNGSLTKEFFFADPQGADLSPVTGDSKTQYNIIVTNGGKTLEAYVVGASPLTSQPVVDIIGSELHYYGKDMPNSYACDILNYADHSELGVKETFTALIYVKAKNCDWVTFDLGNNEFYAKFLRPITVKDPGETNFKDAETGGATANLVLEFVDWRDHNFDDANVTKRRNYYQYYDIVSIVADDDPDHILTNLGQSDGICDNVLSSITNNIKFTFTAPTTADIQGTPHWFGELRYENNGTTVGDFQIKVPVTVIYDWGTIKTYVTCNIENTINN